MFTAEIQRTNQSARRTNSTYNTKTTTTTTTTTETVVVAVRAEKEISNTALAWALTHIIRPGDTITLLAVFSNEPKGRRWSFPRFGGDCGSRHQLHSNNLRDKSPLPSPSPDDRICQISESCCQMVLQFQNQVGVRIKVVSAGAVAAESKKAGANWVVLDKQLNYERKRCMEELHCNIVVMKRSQAKVLRLDLGSSNEFQPPSSSCLIEEFNFEKLHSNRIRHSTPVSSPEDLKTSFTRTTNDEASVSSSDAGTSPFFLCEQNPLFEGHKKEKIRPVYEQACSEDSFASFDSEGEGLPSLVTNPTSATTLTQGMVYWITQNHVINKKKHVKKYKDIRNNKAPTSRTLLERFVQLEQIEPKRLDQTNQRDHVFNSDVRDAVSISRISSAPPPLCSLCQHKAPVFGKPPRWFDYRELEEATDRFSNANFLAEGGLGSVHRGVLRDGQVVAVKQFKVVGSQGEAEFCKEVAVLSCAQHRNVVMLIGFCIEGRKRILVYEYVCNGSLDSHLYGSRRAALDWHSRHKIAIGAARGLRYLHEDCRVGCIVHRDMRPNNILLTHDFEPLVGDFGLARWQPELDLSADPRAIRKLRYLAPEYGEGVKITEKADVYAFGVVLLELITGRKTTDMDRLKGQQYLAEWSCLLLALAEQSQAPTINCKLIDPCLDPAELHDFSHQLRAMARAASLCLYRFPESRPPMSKVLRILEGDTMIPFCLDSDPIGNRSGRLRGLSSNPHVKPRGNHSRKLSH